MAQKENHSVIGRRQLMIAGGAAALGGAVWLSLRPEAAEAPPPCSPGFGPEPARIPFSERIGNDQIEIFPLPAGIEAARNVLLTMSDGASIAINIYRPPGEAIVPVICAFTVYGKDLHPHDYAVCGRAPLFRSAGLDFGSLKVSEATPFEAPDPAYWVPRGFAVIHVDGRGSGASGGKRDPLGERTISDYCEVLDWAARQPWCNGRVATMGVSYLAVAQWFIAERQPKNLAAIVPWEGFNDIYRDLMFHGGIPETAFVGWWLRGNQSASAPGSDNPPAFKRRDSWYAELPLPGQVLTGLALTQHFAPAIDRVVLPRVDLSRITAPALLCGSWSAQGIHSRGAFTAWEEIGSVHKELFTHGRHEWTVAYSPEALDAQELFLTRHLKSSGPVAINPLPVRAEILQDRDRFIERFSATWPLRNTNFTRLYIGSDGKLHDSVPAAAARLAWQADAAERVELAYRMDRDIELCGPMSASLSFTIADGQDADIFIGILKRDAEGSPVYVYNFLKRDELMARGWLRASHRALDTAKSRSYRPVLSHGAPSHLKQGEVYKLEIEILPAGMNFEKGSSLCLLFSGRDLVDNPNCQHKALRNIGQHSVIVGGPDASYITVPLLA